MVRAQELLYLPVVVSDFCARLRAKQFPYRISGYTAANGSSNLIHGFQKFLQKKCIFTVR